MRSKSPSVHMPRSPHEETDAPRAVLLDTSAIIHLANGDEFSDEVLSVILYAGLAEGVFVSSASAIELGFLSRPGGAGAIRFLPDVKTWLQRVVAAPAVMAVPVTTETAIDASQLPEPAPTDVVDRLLIATARDRMAATITRDESILSYAAAGHVRAIRY